MHTIQLIQKKNYSIQSIKYILYLPRFCYSHREHLLLFGSFFLCKRAIALFLMKKKRSDSPSTIQTNTIYTFDIESLNYISSIENFLLNQLNRWNSNEQQKKASVYIVHITAPYNIN